MKLFHLRNLETFVVARLFDPSLKILFLSTRVMFSSFLFKVYRRYKDIGKLQKKEFPLCKGDENLVIIFIKCNETSS